MTARRLQYPILLLTLLPVLALSKVFKGPPAQVVASSITIRWETSDETNVARFVIVRTEISSNGVERISYPAKGSSNSSYQFVDEGIFKAVDRIFSYQIQAVDASGNVIDQTDPLTVRYSPTGLTSAAKRTWGSIKAMFR